MRPSIHAGMQLDSASLSRVSLSPSHRAGIIVAWRDNSGRGPRQTITQRRPILMPPCGISTRLMTAWVKRDRVARHDTPLKVRNSLNSDLKDSRRWRARNHASGGPPRRYSGFPSAADLAPCLTSLYPSKRTSAACLDMSAFCHKRTHVPQQNCVRGW